MSLICIDNDSIQKIAAATGFGVKISENRLQVQLPHQGPKIRISKVDAVIEIVLRDLTVVVPGVELKGDGLRMRFSLR